MDVKKQQIQQQNIQRQPATNQKEKDGGFPWMKAAIIALIVVAVGVGGFFVVSKTNLFSGTSSGTSDFQVTTTSKYFVCYSTANINGKVKAVVSNIVVASKPEQDMDWAKSLFEKSANRNWAKRKNILTKSLQSHLTPWMELQMGLKK